MAIRYKGSRSVLKIARDGQTLVNISAVTLGLDGFDADEVEDTRSVPGGAEQVTSQALGYREGSSSFTVDENATTAPIFVGGNGRRYDIEFSPRGVASGQPRSTFKAIAEVSHSFEARGVRRFSVSLSHNGLITRATH